MLSIMFLGSIFVLGVVFGAGAAAGNSRSIFGFMIMRVSPTFGPILLTLTTLASPLSSEPMVAVYFSTPLGYADSNLRG
jgi:hypothetical protein